MNTNTLQSTIFHKVTHIDGIFSSAMNKSLHSTVFKICTTSTHFSIASITALLLEKCRPRCPSLTSPMTSDELTKAFFYFVACQLCWTWLVIHIIVSITETHYQPPNCIYIHRLVTVNVFQASININGCNFFSMEKFKDISLL